MTFHQAKGLEYPVVFLVAFEQGIFPSVNCFSLSELEEERRICYVGITRSKQKLFITSANSRYLYGSQSYQMPSIYIKEIGKDNLRLLKNNNRFSANTTLSKKEIKPEASKKEENLIFKIGDKMNHKAFGDGMIVEVRGDIITVSFKEPFGVKKLMANHPSIRKI